MEPELRTIRFACHCQTMLEVPADRAGLSIQCPKCGRLVDVPTLSDLASITEDGTYRLDELDLRDEPERLAELQRAFSRDRTDEHGNELDLREYFGTEPPVPRSAEDIEADVLDALDATDDETDVPPPPKYDPETGELVRPLPLLHEPVHIDPATVPMAKAVINYAGKHVDAEFKPWHIIVEMFRFQNLIVIVLIFFTHLFLQLMMFPMAIGMLMILPGFFFLCGALLAHYANVVNDVGFEQKDELPRPLRDLNWSDDMWGPFVNGIVALFVCYGPMLAATHFSGVTSLAIAGTVFIVGTIAFPAVFLTTTTSGTIFNLLPDRVLRVVTVIGPSYLVAIALWAVAAVVYAAGVGGTIMALAALFAPVPASALRLSLPFLLSYAVLLAGIILMHAFCWFLGLQYRAHHEQFDWLLQRYHKEPNVMRPKYGFATLSPEAASKIRPKRTPQNHA